MPPALPRVAYCPPRSLQPSSRVDDRFQQRKYSHGSIHHSSADAIGLGVKNGHMEEDRGNSCLCSWLAVRSPTSAAVFNGADCCSHSVCAVTVICLFAQLKDKDYVDNIPLVIIMSILEPLLGIIVACLPLFRPTIKKVASHMKGARSETPNVISSTMARLRLKRAKGSVIQRFDDSLLLTGLDDHRTQAHSTGPIGHVCSLEGDVTASGTRNSPQSSNTVKQDLEVRSGEAKSLELTV